MQNKNKRLVTCLLAITATLSVMSLNTQADEVDETCDGETPVIMVVAGRTLDRAQMGKYAQALGQSGLYPKAKGYYLNNPRPIRHLEGKPHADDVALMLQDFQHKAAATPVKAHLLPSCVMFAGNVIANAAKTEQKG